MLRMEDLFRPQRQEDLAPGWTGWVEPDTLSVGGEPKNRPWCRGRDRCRAVEWFPRTTKPPWEGTRWAVPSPAGQLRGLQKPGWFVANAFVRREVGFDPGAGCVGQLPPPVLDALYRCLENFYWDSHHRGRP